MVSSNSGSTETGDRIRELEATIKRLEADNRRLLAQRKNVVDSVPDDAVSVAQDWLPQPPAPVASLSKDHVERYSRQLLIQGGFGVDGQKKLLSSSVLVVGAGGIGSTVLPYLAAAGVGRLTILDFDAVETSNLHRQVIHKSCNVGMNKAISACRFLKDLNPTIDCEALSQALSHDNALDLVSRHDCVVDASDNPKTRYLINDACVLARKPLVSGSAIGMEGQLTVYNLNGGPCYRCLYPKTSATASGKACSDNGVLGTVPGLVGILQATETIKVLTGMGETMHDRLLMYDAVRCSVLCFKKPPKQRKCQVCSSRPTTGPIRSMLDSYESLQGVRGPAGCGPGGSGCTIPVHPNPPPLPEEITVSCQEYHQIRVQGTPHVLLDVRVKEQFAMCALDGAINIPLSILSDELDRIESLSDGDKPVYCICRRGIFSLDAASVLHEARVEGRAPRIHSVRNIAGGLTAWRLTVDESFPQY